MNWSRLAASSGEKPETPVTLLAGRLRFAWPIEARDETDFHRIIPNQEDDRNGRRRRLGHQRRGRAADGYQDSQTEPNELARECGQALIVAHCPTVLDGDVLALDIAGFAQASAEGSGMSRRFLW